VTNQYQVPCWLFHKWSPWGNPKEGRQRYSPDGEWEDTIIQGRKCLKCNKRQLRGAR